MGLEVTALQSWEDAATTFKSGPGAPPVSIEEIIRTMKRIVALSALGVLTSALFAQGLNTPPGQTKEDWEEINFEFNSSILSDGYPGLLRLADLLSQHRDFKVAVIGNTDWVGTQSYNDKLSVARATTVKDFLVKYGANADQVSVSGEGKQQPEVANTTREGRFINRRVTLRVTDGQGKLVKEGGIAQVLNVLQPELDKLAKKQQECCDAILKRLDKLDDILAAVKSLEGENAALKGELADQRNQINSLKDQLTNAPKPTVELPPPAKETPAADTARTHNPKFSLLGINVGPNFGTSKEGNASLDANGRFFAPFGSEGSSAVQAQGEFIYNTQEQEGQFDLGLVNRWGNVQAGLFGSFKYLSYRQYQSGGALAQGSFLLDYIFNGGRIGLFGTQGFKNYAVVNNQTLAPGAFLQTYAKVVNQYGFDALFGVWGNAYLQGNVGLLRRVVNGGNTAGLEIKLTQPVSKRVALTAAVDYNQTSVASTGNGQVMFGVEMGSFIHPKDYGNIKTPVPMDVPRVRYEFATRRVGASPPIANAGPNQSGVPAGTVTLNGSASYDPLGETLTYAWSQISGPAVTINNANQAIATFTGVAGQTYQFMLKVTNTDNLSGQASTAVVMASPLQTQITQFTAQPASITLGQTSTLSWVIQNATSASIAPGVGAVNPSTGSVPVSPAVTTTYTLTAIGANGTVTQTVQVVVGANSAQILRFAANPSTIPVGGQSTLSWTTSGAATVSISPTVGTVAANGSTTVSPAATTTYTITATGADGKAITAAATVTVTATAAQIIRFAASPSTIPAGGQATLSWSINGATTASISPTVGTVAANGSAVVSPTATTSYTISATGLDGKAVTAVATVTVGPATAQILRFAASPSTIAMGAQSTLSWTTSGATSVSISPTVGTVAANGSVAVSPVSTTSYTITATSANGNTVTAVVTVTVTGSAVPSIVAFTATPQTVSAGQSTQICWQVTGATSIAIAPGVGTNLNANDCATVTPSATTTYTLTATNAIGQVQGNLTVNVGSVQILSFQASPVSSPAAGSPVVLSWTTANATSVVLTAADLPAMTLPVNGSYTDSPITNETYTLTAYGPGGQTVSVTISVFVR